MLWFKSCVACPFIQPIHHFRKQSTYKDGHDGHCRTCRNRKERIYYANHREHIRAYQLDYYTNNREVILARERELYQENCEEIRAYQRDYYATHPKKMADKKKRKRKKHPDTDRLQVQRRRANKAAIPICDFTELQWKELQQMYGYRCVYCGRKPRKLTMDHIIPISLGGYHTAINIVPACQSCNSRKHTKGPLNPIQPVLLTISPPRMN